MAEGRYTYAIGRRKTSTAQVKLYEGVGENLINGKKFEEVFTLKVDRARLLQPFVVTDLIGKYHFTAEVSGGGSTGQLGAVRLGIARALVESDKELKTILKKDGLVTRDPRMKERKKVYIRGARRGKQFSKR